jgi:hypothetical protein
VLFGLIKTYMTRALTYLGRYIIAMIKKLNSKGTMNGALTILTGVLVLIGSGIVTQAMAQQNQSASDNASSTGSSANMTATSADSEGKLSDFVKKLGVVMRQSNVNLTLPENVTASEAIQKLQSSPGFKALSEKFTQLAQQSGINASDVQLKNLQGEVGTGNFTGLVDRLQQLEERIQNRTQQ